MEGVMSAIIMLEHNDWIYVIPRPCIRNFMAEIGDFIKTLT